MTILVATANYPHPGHAFSGIFNERSVSALRRQGHQVRVLAPRPYAPKLLCRVVARWRPYAAIAASEVRDGVDITRPAYPQAPVVGGPMWFEHGAYLTSRRLVRRMHAATPFDGILGFGLFDGGALAWRLARDIGVVAIGWATGGDVRVGPSSLAGRAVARTVASLDLVFYQSRELLEAAARLLGTDAQALPPDRHIVLPRGVAISALADGEARRRARAALGVADDAVLVLNIGRVVREKGIFELLGAIEGAVAKDSRIVCRVIGAMPTFDDTRTAQAAIDGSPSLRHHVRLLPACPPAQVPELLAAADIFAFTSHHEGMPNSLLEAMSAGVPAVAFGIPPVRDIAGATDALRMVSPFDAAALGQELLRLAASPEYRSGLGQAGRERVTQAFSIDRSMARAMLEMSRLAGTRARTSAVAAGDVVAEGR